MSKSNAMQASSNINYQDDVNVGLDREHDLDATAAEDEVDNKVIGTEPTDLVKVAVTTSIPGGPLHPLPVPDKQFDSVAIDFMGPLTKDDGFDAIITMTKRLNADIQLALCKTDMMAEEFMTIFFDKWFCKNGLPLELITNHNKLFVLCF